MKIGYTCAAFVAIGALGATPSLAADVKDGPELVKQVADQLGIELFGYGRGGFYPKTDEKPAGGYTLGGAMQKFRLGNEGDNYLEFGIGKVFDLGNGVKWGIHYMPYYHNGETGTKQGYVDISGMDILPGAKFWAGQRYHRLQDIHFIDRWVFEDGDNFGAGVDGINVGLGKLNGAAYTSGTFDNTNANRNNALRTSFQWHDIPANPGGKLTVPGSGIAGNVENGSSGSAWGLRHNQELTKGWNNTVFLQTSNGHADINGKFYGLTTASTSQQVTGGPGAWTITNVTTANAHLGARQRLVADAMDWQFGKFGGQAMIGWVTRTPDGGNEIRDFSAGGRVSYAVAPHTKLLAELGNSSRSGDGAKQTLNKGTLALAFAVNDKFWSRPEFRLYVTRANWNEAAAIANASTFGKNGRRNDTIAGIQVEAWW